MATPRILMVLTSHDRLGKTGQPTGFWLEEFTSPYYAFMDAGAIVTLASIQGGQPPIDPKSDQADAQTETTQRFLSNAVAQQALAQTTPVSEVNAADYDAIFLPGGHGTMWDFPSSATLTNLLEAFNQSEKVIAAVCHAPAALVTMKNAAGEPFVKGRRITAFTDSEERGVGLETVVPFLLESRLRELGAQFEAGQDWGPLVQQDGNLITGQNPASSEPVAQSVLAALS
ncbi:type 1 glutamine amidotransferase domain-containing protein [filamentous cyanobacterium LEGE 11480]|uniref:Type 1 glutamine amidotransferase domain-containing protein n=1 Tax=Romeriopsis navalis LEGE 11480 TaxID=2777977 RepID=A0A928VU80_9CYAN|nr:type 1 glutamine amidotransferase domain-containing protein [Romeriopsis navalis]MBE9033161.1 type 1 glutamine amidotransferase domain-containing protein [Romeriopsis navalis LEGE 11480]